ncbi:MAG: VOC family protein [Dehalococcoidia bacterium]
MRIQRIDHVGIEVRDLARAESFYTGILGLNVVGRFHNQVLMQGEGFNLALFQNPAMEPMGGGDISDPLGKGHWAFEVDAATLAEAQDRFQREGVPYHGPVDWGDHDCLYFLDPDGNLLEVLAYA